MSCPVYQLCRSLVGKYGSNIVHPSLSIRKTSQRRTKSTFQTRFGGLVAFSSLYHRITPSDASDNLIFFHTDAVERKEMCRRLGPGITTFLRLTLGQCQVFHASQVAFIDVRHQHSAECLHSLDAERPA